MDSTKLQKENGVRGERQDNLCRGWYIGFKNIYLRAKFSGVSRRRPNCLSKSNNTYPKTNPENNFRK